jgi:sulfur-carrier protein
MIKILFFGSVAEVTGKTEQLEKESQPVKELIGKLEQQYPALKGRKFKVSVDKKIINDQDTVIPENAEVAILPPFSGG